MLRVFVGLQILTDNVMRKTVSVLMLSCYASQNVNLLKTKRGFNVTVMLRSLPKDQDCHELWSKRRKKVMRDPGVEKKTDLPGETTVSHSGSGNQWSPESEASNTKHSDVQSPTATSQRKHY